MSAKKTAAKKVTTKKVSAKPKAKAPAKPKIKTVEDASAGLNEAAPAAEAKDSDLQDKPIATEKKISALDAAAKVLSESKEPLTTKQMIDAMAAKGYWTSPGGKTPQATLYSSILREINVKGAEARFKKTDRGHFSIKS